MDAETPLEKFFKIPPITRSWLTSIIFVTVGARFGFVPLARLAFAPDYLLYYGQVWRLLTCFMYIGKLSFAWIINLMMLVQYSWRYETNCYPNAGAGGGTIADYTWTIVLGMSGLILLNGFFMGGYFFGEALSMFVFYVYSKRNPTEMVTVWGLPPGGMPCWYLPFALLALNVVMEGDPMPLLMGISVGHLYYYIKVVLAETPGPLQNLRHLLSTPHVVSYIFNVEPTDVGMGRVTLLQLRQGGFWGALGCGWCCKTGGRRVEAERPGFFGGAWNAIMGLFKGNPVARPPAPGFHRLDPVAPRQPVVIPPAAAATPTARGPETPPAAGPAIDEAERERVREARMRRFG